MPLTNKPNCKEIGKLKTQNMFCTRHKKRYGHEVLDVLDQDKPDFEWVENVVYFHWTD